MSSSGSRCFEVITQNVRLSDRELAEINFAKNCAKEDSSCCFPTFTRQLDVCCFGIFLTEISSKSGEINEIISNLDNREFGNFTSRKFQAPLSVIPFRNCNFYLYLFSVVTDRRGFAMFPRYFLESKNGNV